MAASHHVYECVIHSTDSFKTLIHSGIRIKWLSILLGHYKSLTDRCVQSIIFIQERNTILCIMVGVKAPMYFKWNRRTNWYDVISNKIRPKRSSFWVRFEGQAGEQHLQVTSNINTLCWIAELPQIYPHLYDRSWRDFKDSEKAFNS